MYSDEAKPNNKLKPGNRRSREATYLNILQLGSHVFAKEDTWLTLAAVRSSDIAQCEAGMAQLMAAVLRMMFDSNSHDLRHSGINLELHGGGSFKLWADPGLILGDECALHSIFIDKGSSGTRPCIHCLNIVDKLWKGATGVEEHSQIKA